MTGNPWAFPASVDSRLRGNDEVEKMCACESPEGKGAGPGKFFRREASKAPASRQRFGGYRKSGCNGNLTNDRGYIHLVSNQTHDLRNVIGISVDMY
jgi:hypothetical protein